MTDTQHPEMSPADECTRRAYRAANEALAADERPSPAVRAAVIAAAARQVQARPQAVGRRRWRAPLAAAASLLIGTVAWVLATRHEEPSSMVVIAESTPPPSPQPGAPAPAPSAPAAELAPAQKAFPASPEGARGQVPRQAAERRDGTVTRPVEPPMAPAPAAEPARPAAPTAKPSADAAKPAAPPPQPDQRVRREQPLAAPERNNAPEVRTAEPTTAPAAPPSARAGLAGAATNDRAADAAAPAAAAAAGQLAKEQAEEKVTARPVARTAPMSDVPPLPPEEARRWIERIVELRRAGRDAEADAELRALRARAPEVTVPAEAQPAPR